MNPDPKLEAMMVAWAEGHVTDRELADYLETLPSGHWNGLIRRLRGLVADVATLRNIGRP